MTGPDPNEPAVPPPSPGERRLAHPPSDRYRVAEAAAAARDEAIVRPVSIGRGLAYAALVEIGAAAAISVLGGVLTITWGLLVLAAFSGWATAWAMRTGAGGGLPADRRAGAAVVLAVGGVLLGALGLWLFARTEGGVLPFLEYLGEAFGAVVPVAVLLSAIVAWLTAR